jgi:hypothetical protein
MPSAKLSRSVPGFKSPFSHPSLSVETSSTLDKYPREVLPLTVEDNQPQDRYYGCQSRATVIQEHVITNDVHDYWSEQHQRQSHEPVHEQQRAAYNLQSGNNPIKWERNSAPMNCPANPVGIGPMLRKFKKPLRPNTTKIRPSSSRAIKITIFISTYLLTYCVNVFYVVDSFIQELIAPILPRL